MEGAGDGRAWGAVACDLEIWDPGARGVAAEEAVGAGDAGACGVATEGAVGAEVDPGDAGTEVPAILLCTDTWGCDGLGRAWGGVTLTGRTVSTFGDAMKRLYAR